MKRKLKQPKIIIYENVEKASNILLQYFGMGGDMDTEDIPSAVTEILKAFDIPLGKKTEIELFENNVQAEFITDKKGIARVRVITKK